MTSLLLLDIDGVLNPFYARYSETLTGFTEYLVRNRSFFLNAKMQVPFLSQVNEHSDIETVWVSGWQEESNLIFEALELDQHWNHVTFNEEPGRGTWKLPSVQEFISHGDWDRIVWCDDEIEEDTVDWAMNLPMRIDLIVPDRFVGLVPHSYADALSHLTS